MKRNSEAPAILMLNQMAGPMTWTLAEDLASVLGPVALLTGHPDTLARGSTDSLWLFSAAPYVRGSLLRRVLSWLHYVAQVVLWLWRWPRHVPLLLYTNPPMLCWVGLLARALRGQEYMVAVHDVYPDVLVGLGGYSERNPLIRLWRRFNKVAYERASGVYTLGEHMASKLALQFDVRKTRLGRIAIVYPSVDSSRIKPIPKAQNWFAQRYGQVDMLTVMYSGNMGLGHDIEAMVEAAQRLQDSSNIHFMFIGSGPKWQVVADAKTSQQLANVTLLGWQPEEVLPYSLATADIALISLEEQLAGLAVPSKAIYAMAAGSALLVQASQDSELAEWTWRLGAGLVLDPRDGQEELVRGLKALVASPQLLQQMRRNARLAAESHFGHHHSSQQIVELLSVAFPLSMVASGDDAS